MYHFTFKFKKIKNNVWVLYKIYLDSSKHKVNEKFDTHWIWNIIMGDDFTTKIKYDEYEMSLKMGILHILNEKISRQTVIISHLV